MTKQKTDYTVQVLAPNKMVPESPTPTAFLIPQLILRFLVLAFTLSAVLVAVTARQSASFLSFVFKATYKDSSATRYLLLLLILKIFCINQSAGKFY